MSEVAHRTTLRAQLRKSMLAEAEYTKYSNTAKQLEQRDFDVMKLIQESKNE